MPDLVTHSTAGYVLAHFVRRTELALVLLGSLLPDLCTRIPNFIFNTFQIQGGEDWVRPLHAPLPLLLVALLVSFWFAEAMRGRVFFSLLLGIGSHLVLDVLQRRSPVPGFQVVHERGYQWFFPFSQVDFQLGWFGPEDSLYILPLTLAIFWLVWRRRVNAHLGRR